MARSMYPVMDAQLAVERGSRTSKQKIPRARSGLTMTPHAGKEAEGDAADGFVRIVSKLGLPREKASQLLRAHRKELIVAVARARRGERPKASAPAAGLPREKASRLG